MNELFYNCVELLRTAAKLVNMSYEEINIWLFVIIMPLLIIALIISNFFWALAWRNAKRMNDKNINKKLDN